MFSRTIQGLALAAGLAINIHGAMAGAASDAAAKAEALAAEGKTAEALAAIEDAKLAIWQAVPLSFGKAIFVASDPQGYGIYDVRDSSSFKQSEPLVVYFEPLGYDYARDGDIYVIDLALDFEITTPAGESLHKQNEFAHLTLRSRFPNKEFMGKLTYDFSGVQPGDYIVKTTVKDVKSGKNNAFSLPFTMTQ